MDKKGKIIFYCKNNIGSNSLTVKKNLKCDITIGSDTECT